MSDAVLGAGIGAVGDLLGGIFGGGDSDRTVTTENEYPPGWLKEYSTADQKMLMDYIKGSGMLENMFGYGASGGATSVPYQRQAENQTVASLSPYQGKQSASLPWV